MKKAKRIILIIIGFASLFFIFQNFTMGDKDFNSLIDENMQEEKAIHKKLAKQTGTSEADVSTVRTKRELANVGRMMVRPEAENVAVDDDSNLKTEKRADQSNSIDKKKMDRLSKEIDINEQ
jgi:hypothetical protein